MKIPGAQFWQRLSCPKGHNAAKRFKSSIEKYSDLTGSGSHDLPAYLEA
jgi:hypothetical protein